MELPVVWMVVSMTYKSQTCRVAQRRKYPEPEGFRPYYLPVTLYLKRVVHDTGT
jgi:hypothetical protein